MIGGGGGSDGGGGRGGGSEGGWGKREIELVQLDSEKIHHTKQT